MTDKCRDVNRWLLVCLVISLVVGVSYSAPAPVRAQGSAPRYESSRCWFTGAVGAQCGYIIVPEDRANPVGPTIKLAVAVFKSRAANAQPDPIIFLQGGPGGGSVEDFAAYLGPIWSQAMRRDVIFLDQRGTGLSEPNLECSELSELIISTLDKNLKPREGAALEVKATLACRDRLVKAGVNLAAFTNKANAADVNDVRIALGYAQWNLYGVSYGTELALTVMRDFPDKIRSVILDSVVPLQADLMSDTSLTARRVFDTLFWGCAADSACSNTYPDLERVTYDLIAKLNESPVQISVYNNNDGRTYEALINGDALVNVIFTSFYITPFIARLPAMIYGTRDGDYDILQQVASEALFAFDGIAYAMFYSVTCENEYPFSSLDKAKISAMVTPPVLRESDVVGAETNFQLCAVWGMKAADNVENQPVASSIPALVLSGEYDPVTPPVYAEVAAETLKNHYQFVFPGLGHGVLLDSCAGGMLVDFVIDPSTSPDSSCIQTMRGPQWELR